MKKRVLLGMSGGIDSSVSAFLLKEQGYEVIGAYMNYWHDTSHIPEDQLHSFPENKCCSTESLFAARQIGAELGFPVYTVNYTEQFRNTVVEHFLKAHEKGLTPNPCIRCNIDIKFGAFFEKMKELGCDYLATGHYAQIGVRSQELGVRKEKKSLSEQVSRRAPACNVSSFQDSSHPFLDQNPPSPPYQGGAKHPLDSPTLQTNQTNQTLQTNKLFSGVDPLKDQSYFLYHLNAEVLSHTLFPLGGMHKSEVKELAKKYRLKEILEKKESQGVCFFPEESYVPFLERYIPNIFKDGEVVYHGKIIGKHRGLPRYTIGQRRGIDIGGFPSPIYVIGFDYEKNELLMGDDDELFKDSLIADEWIFTGDLQQINLQNQQLFARIRHLGRLTPCTVEFLEDEENRSEQMSRRAPACNVSVSETISPLNTVKIPKQSVKIHFQEKIRGVTPGQIAVVYTAENQVVGGGVIQ